MREYYDPVAYDAQALGVPGDIEFFAGLAKEAHAAGHPVLELACGTGRVAIPIAREGASVVGLDRSTAMLARAREKSAGLGNVRWVEGDMRSFELPERFGLVFIPFRSFQHLLTTDDQLSCLRCCLQHLVPGGRLALDVFNPDIVRIANWLTVRQGGLQLIRGADERRRHWESADYMLPTQRLDVTFIDEEVDDSGAVISRLYRDLRLRYVFRYEMEHLLARAGYEVEALYGDCLGSPLVDTSPELVWVARRPA